MGSLLLSHLDEGLVTTDQRSALERELPRPFLVAWFPLPSSVSSALRRILFGHSSTVKACAVSADGRMIVSASYDTTLKVWDAATGTCLLTFPVEDKLFDCTFHPDGEHLLACGQLGL